MDYESPRLILHPFTPSEAARVMAGEPAGNEAWAPDYPFADEIDPLRSLAAQTGEVEHPFTMYAIRIRETNTAIGGLGFFGPPKDGTVEVGYGLVPSARGRGYATEALRRAVEIARKAGARRVVADTSVENLPSQNVMSKVGFIETDRSETLVYYSLDL